LNLIKAHLLIEAHLQVINAQYKAQLAACGAEIISG
jgi:hypothetical protein